MNIQKSQNLFVNWEKVGKYLRTILKNPNFESMDQLGKVIHISDIMRYFITLVKVFPIWNFWTHWEFCAHHRIFGFKKDPEYLSWLMILIWWFMIYIAISSPRTSFSPSSYSEKMDWEQGWNFSATNFDSWTNLFGSFPVSWIIYWRCIACDLLEYNILGYTFQSRKFEKFINVH